MPVGRSMMSLHIFGKSVEDMIGWQSDGKEEKKHKSSVAVAKAVERFNLYRFLEE